MTAVSAPAWRFTGLVWRGREVSVAWLAPTGDVRTSDVGLGSRLALVAGPDRRCVGVWHDGRRIPCATRTPIDPAATSGQCTSCAAMARSRSVATDTQLDDPREFSVYLAHHGYLVKVGITATQRGHARLLEQGALAATILSSGTLISARRCESLLSTVLGLPQQVRTARKRQARTEPGTAAGRETDLREISGRARTLSWPAGQTRRTGEPFDLTTAYGLGPRGVAPSRAVAPLAAGHAVVGDVVCRIGRDLYLGTPGGVVLVDTGLLQGWAFTRAVDDASLSTQLVAVRYEARPEPEALF